MRIIAGEWGGRRLQAPKGSGVRPTSDRVREAWMSALGGRLSELMVVDLFAGSGALGLEALSRGAAHAVFVDRGRAALRALESNIAALDATSRCTVIRGDAIRYVDRLAAGAFDVALADPPYGKGLAAEVMERYVSVPFARELWVEHRTGEPLPQVAGLVQRRYGDTMLSCVETEGS